MPAARCKLSPLLFVWELGMSATRRHVTTRTSIDAGPGKRLGTSAPPGLNTLTAPKSTHPRSYPRSKFSNASTVAPVRV